MKRFKKIIASKAITLDGPLFQQSYIRRNNRRNSHLVFWYQINDVVYVLAGFILDAIFMADSLYHNSLVEAIVSVIGFVLCLAITAFYDNKTRSSVETK